MNKRDVLRLRSRYSHSGWIDLCYDVLERECERAGAPKKYLPNKPKDSLEKLLGKYLKNYQGDWFYQEIRTFRQLSNEAEAQYFDRTADKLRKLINYMPGYDDRQKAIWLRGQGVQSVIVYKTFRQKKHWFDVNCQPYAIKPPMTDPELVIMKLEQSKMQAS